MDNEILTLIGRKMPLFTLDIHKAEALLSHTVMNSRFLVLGGAGSIGQTVVKEIFKRQPQKLHVVDISENNMVELVRDQGESVNILLNFTQFFETRIEYRFQIFTAHSCDFLLPSYARLA